MKGIVKHEIKIESKYYKDKFVIPCYILEDGRKMIHNKVNQWFNEKAKNLPQIAIIDKKGKEVKVYQLNAALGVINIDKVRDIASLAINQLLGEDDLKPVQDRELSEFDEAILKAMKYNPKENKE